MIQPVIFAARDIPGQHRFFAQLQTLEPFTDSDLQRYGVNICLLTPTFNKRSYTFSVQCKGKRWKGHVTTQGDLVVRVATPNDLPYKVQ